MNGQVMLYGTDGYPTFRISFDKTDSYAKLNAEEITAWYSKDEPCTFVQACSIDVKWDGDAHCNMGDGDGYLYFGGRHDMEKHCNCFQVMYAMGEWLHGGFK